MLYTEEAHEIICEAYTYGYPLVLMDVTRQAMTAPIGGTHRATINQFIHARSFAENPSGNLGADADSLHSAAWLNVGREPIVLSVPHVADRFYSIQLIDGWMKAFGTLGTRTTGARSASFAIVGPRWSGQIPAGVRVVESPTALVWLTARIQARSAADYPSVHEIQGRFGLTPLSMWGQDNVPLRPVVAREITPKTTASEQVAHMDASSFFGRLNLLLSDNPPRAGDIPALKRFAMVGVGPGRPFELRDDPLVSRSVDGSVRTALARIVVEATKPSNRLANGWQLQPSNLGNTESDYMTRAVVALVNPGAAPAEDHVSFHTTLDSEGNRLTGAHRYVLRFASGNTPAVNGFWSIGLHSSRRTLVPNPIDRYAISSSDDLHTEGDGSIAVRIQHEPPAKRALSNWLPSPKDQFNLTLQLHWPQRAIVDGSWVPPSIERLA
jgi:hypothetical protein